MNPLISRGTAARTQIFNDVTSSLQTLMNDFGWSGNRYANPDAWPQDFVEACSPATFGAGLDSTFADAVDLAVYAGHGNAGLLQWGFKNGSMCTVDFASSTNVSTKGVMRLGQMSGAQTMAGMWLTSCTLKKDRLASKANFQWARQQFGYHNSPSIGDDQPSNFFFSAAFWLQSNKNAWLDEMEDKPGVFTGDNSPIIVSYGATSAQANDIHNNTRFGGSTLTPRPGGPSCGGGVPAFFFVSTLGDHGTSSTCN
jgi:hypothetical protein